MKYRDHPLIESRAKALYDSIFYPLTISKPTWVTGGNSGIQEDCRRDAIKQLEFEGVNLFDTYWTFQRQFEDRRIIARLVNPSVLDFEISAKFGPADMDIRAEFHGMVKFDGCFNWSTSDNYMAHMCNLGEFEEVKRAFEIVRDMAAAHIEAWIA